MKTSVTTLAELGMSLTIGFALASPAQASTAMATEFGCINCHGSHLRGESPTLAQLAEKMAKYRGDEAALAQKVAKYRRGEVLEHIDAHERLSLERATVLLRWLADGAR